ncbi:MAG: hypothetical protein AB7G28_20265 [Pirellulales bacterium]
MTTNPEESIETSPPSRDQYVLRYGVLGWGVTTAVLFTISNAMEHGWDDFFFHLVPALILFPLGGVFFGRIMWNYKQRQLAKDTKSR